MRMSSLEARKTGTTHCIGVQGDVLPFLLMRGGLSFNSDNRKVDRKEPRPCGE
jgi:hypothetical protein